MLMKKLSGLYREWKNHSLSAALITCPGLLLAYRKMHHDRSGLMNIVKRYSEYKRLLILGNADNLNLISVEAVKELARSYLILGLNRAPLKYKAHINLWADNKALIDVYRGGGIPNSDIFLQVSCRSRKEKVGNTRFWVQHKSFDPWPYQNQLFMSRNILTAAIHLAVLLEIQSITLIGVDLETRNYFTSHEKKNIRLPYEILNRRAILKDHLGYTSQKIVKEILEYVIAEKNITVKSLFKNKYLSTINGLKFESVENFQRSYL